MKGELIIKVNGRKRVHKDLILDNYKEFIQHFLLGGEGKNKPSGLTDYTDLVDNKEMLIGTGTTSPTRSDTALANQVASTTSVTTTVGSTFISFAASITVASAYDITEAGLQHHLWTNSNVGSPTYEWRLLTRDTFPAVTLSANDTISITVKLNM